MAHFAQLDENNVVMQVIVVNNEELRSTVTIDEVEGFINVTTVESEAKGIIFCQSLFGSETAWKQTSYSGSFRGKYAGIGDKFENGVFFNPNVPVVEAALITQDIEMLSTQDIQVLATEQVQALSSAQVESLTTAQLQSLSTAQISALEV